MSLHPNSNNVSISAPTKSRMTVDVTNLSKEFGDGDSTVDEVDAISASIKFYDHAWVIWSDLKEYVHYLGAQHLLFNRCTYSYFCEWTKTLGDPVILSEPELPTQYARYIFEKLRLKMKFYCFDYDLQKEHFLRLLY